MVAGNNKEEIILPSAKLLATLGTHKRSRVLSPIEAAHEIKIFLQNGGRIEQLPISKETIREFLSLLQLSESIQKFIGWGGINKGEIGLISGYRISSLKNKKDQENLAKYVLERELTSKEVHKIVRYKNRMKEKNIEECIDSVIEMRPKKRHVIITKLEDEIYKIVIEKSKLLNIDSNKIIQNIFYKLFAKTLLSFNMKNNFIMIMMDQNGEKKFKNMSIKYNTSINNIINIIIKENIKSDNYDF